MVHILEYNEWVLSEGISTTGDTFFSIMRELVSFHNVFYRLLNGDLKIDFKKGRLIESVFQPLFSKTNRLSDKVFKTMCDVRNEFVATNRDEINNLYFDDDGNLLKNDDVSVRLRKRRLSCDFLGEVKYQVFRDFKLRLNFEFETMYNEKMVDYFKEYDYIIDNKNNELYGNKMAISLFNKLIDDKYIPEIEGLNLPQSYYDRPIAVRRNRIPDYSGSFTKVFDLLNRMEKKITIKVDDHRIQDLVDTLYDDKGFGFFMFGFDKLLSHEITHFYQADLAYIKNLLKKYLKDFGGDKIAMQNALSAYVQYDSSNIKNKTDAKEAYKAYLKSPKEYQARVISTARALKKHNVDKESLDRTIYSVVNIHTAGDQFKYGNLNIYSDFYEYYRLFKNDTDNVFKKFKEDVKKLFK